MLNEDTMTWQEVLSHPSLQDLYLEAGVVEVWFCTLEGQMGFYNAQGQLEQSGLVPDSPQTLTI
jgi:hypothetical protein